MNKLAAMMMIFVPLTVCYQRHSKKAKFQNVRSSKLEVAETPILEIIYLDVFLSTTSHSNLIQDDNRMVSGEIRSKSDIVIIDRGKVLHRMSVRRGDT